jgi:hypothetical protein
MEIQTDDNFTRAKARLLEIEDGAVVSTQELFDAVTEWQRQCWLTWGDDGVSLQNNSVYPAGWELILDKSQSDERLWYARFEPAYARLAILAGSSEIRVHGDEDGDAHYTSLYHGEGKTRVALLRTTPGTLGLHHDPAEKVWED